MKARIVYNPVAGQRDVHAEIAQVLDYLYGLGWDVAADETHSPGDATRYAKSAARNGCQLVFAAGGDGTLNEVLNGLVGTGAALGTLPVGTGNVWAREIGMPVWSPLHPWRLLDAVKAVEDGLVYAADVGWANGRHFLLWAGVGLDARVLEEVEPQLEIKRRWGWAAFVAEAVIVSLSFVGTSATVTTEQRVLRKRVLMVLASNTQSYSGGLFRAAPEAALDDGRLDVCVFQGAGFSSTLRHAWGMFTQQHLRDPEVRYYRTRYLRIESRRPLPVHVDGVPIGHTPLEISVLPKSIRLLVPAQIRPGLFTDAANRGTPLKELAR